MRISQSIAPEEAFDETTMLDIDDTIYEEPCEFAHGKGSDPLHPTPERTRVAYLMSRFPKLTETFILFELLAVEKQGIDVEIYPLLREHPPVMHPEAVALVERAHYQPFLSWPILK